MVASEQHLYQTIVLPRTLATGSIHDYLFCYCPLVGILFEVLRIVASSTHLFTKLLVSSKTARQLVMLFIGNKEVQ